MGTPLPKNEFIPNSSARPVPEGSAGATPCPQPPAPAAPISESTLDPATGVDAAAAPDLTDPPDAAAADHIHEIFFYVRKLMKQQPRFMLDEAAFMAEVEEEPLFIRDGEHLRRWG